MPDGNEVQQTETHVENAVEQVKEAATTAPTVAIEDVLKAVTDTLQGVQVELKRANDAREESTKAVETVEPPATPTAPDVEVETPTPPERKVRRGGRKVTRRG